MRASSNGKIRGLHPPDAGSIPAARSSSRGGSSKAEFEVASFGIRVRSPVAAPRSTWISIHEPVLWGGPRIATPSKRVRFPPGSPGLVSTTDVRAASTRRVGGSNPSRGAIDPSSCPHLLDGQGNRVLNPGTRVRIPLGTPARRSSSAPCRESRRRYLPVSAAPSTGLRSRSSPFNSEQGGRAPLRGTRTNKTKRGRMCCGKHGAL